MSDLNEDLQHYLSILLQSVATTVSMRTYAALIEGKEPPFFDVEELIVTDDRLRERFSDFCTRLRDLNGPDIRLIQYGDDASDVSLTMAEKEDSDFIESEFPVFKRIA